jgi:putative permease
VAILVFGGLWGFWGVFFAIPLATLVQAVIRSWPSKVLPSD